MTYLSLESLLSEVKTLVDSAEALLETTAHDASSAVGGVRERAERSLAAAKARLKELEAGAEAKARAAARQTDRYVHENPWTSIGLGAVVGVLVGLLMGRRER